MRNLILLLSVFVLSGCVQRGDARIVAVTQHASKDFKVNIKEDKEIKEFLEL